MRQITEDREQKAETAKIIDFPKHRRRADKKPHFLQGGNYLDRCQMFEIIEDKMSRVEDLAREIREMI